MMQETPRKKTNQVTPYMTRGEAQG